MASDEDARPRKAKWAPLAWAALGAVLVAGAALRVRREVAKTPTPRIETAPTTTPISTSGITAAPSAAPRATRPGMAALPPDVVEALERAPKEPLDPVVLPAEDVPLAPGAVMTAEPLDPVVLPAEDVPLAPGAVASTEPLVPPVIEDPPAPTDR